MIRRALSLAILALVLCMGGLAQTIDAILSGTVADPSGALIPGATVTAINVATGVTTKTVSNNAGSYQLPPLAPGRYRVSAETSGFKKFTFTEVNLEVGTRATLDFKLDVGTVTEAVEVKASAETLQTATATIGGTVSGRQILDLPLPSRDALGLVFTQAGLVGDNFAGARLGALNITFDGINVQDNRINSGVFSPIFQSVDKVAEFRVVTSPADAELGRGSGQIQVISRSGTNEFHGSLFEFHRNTLLNANTWFNNQRGRDASGAEISPRNILIRNQFGGRVEGPIIKNKLFFAFLADFQREVTRNAVNTTVLTPQARQGLFRFFPGAQNGNIEAARPTVDINGNPVRPSTATGDLQTINLLSYDPNRRAIDPTVARTLGFVPLPNNYRFGDGLNTAGYTWSRGATSDRDQWNLKIDYNLNERNRISFSWTKETNDLINAFLAQPFPEAPGGTQIGRDQLYTFNVTSTIRPTLLNEFRAGVFRPRVQFLAPWEVEGTGIFPARNNVPFAIDFLTITDPINVSNDPQGRISPVYSYQDIMRWNVGKHAFKWGGMVQFTSTNGYNSFNVLPRGIVGSGGAPIVGVPNVAGIGLNNGLAQNLLNNLSGSLANLLQAFNASAPPNPAFLSGEYKQRTWRQREVSWFFQDDWKVTRRLTLNLGVRWEYYGVPWDANGRTAGLVGGSAGIFGLSGASFGDLYQAGRVQNGSLTNVELVGKNSPKDQPLYRNDWNNFAPAVGLAYNVPWFGENKTVFRAGFGMGYERNSLRNFDVIAGDQPGLRVENNFRQGNFLSVGNAPLPLEPTAAPLATVSLQDRGQSVRAYDTGIRTPYIMNWNISLQRTLPGNATVEARYVGSKGTRLLRAVNVNEANIFETQILDAFLAAQRGGTHPLLDRIFSGISVPGGGTVGTDRTGGDYMRALATTQTQLAANNAGLFATFLNATAVSTNDPRTATPGGWLRRAGLPENFIVGNPQFAAANLVGNFANSTFHSFQLEYNKRFSNGWNILANYTFAKALGEEEGAGQELLDSFRFGRNRRLEKRPLTFGLRHVYRSSGVYDLPFGPGKKWASGNSWMKHVVGGWQVGGIWNMFSGQPMNVLSGRSSVNQFGGDNPPLVAQAISSGIGSPQRLPNGVTFFPGFSQQADPIRQTMTTAGNIQQLSALLAVYDQSGRLLFSNPGPGQLGNLQPFFLTGPRTFRLDINVAKTIRLARDGRVNLQFRADAIDALNRPIWDVDNLNLDINSVNFGRFTAAGGTRIVVVSGRFNF